MEAIPFLLMHLYVIAQLLLLPIAYIAIAVFFTSVAFPKSRIGLKVSFLTIAILAPIALLANGYFAFRQACDATTFEKFSNRSVKNIDGFLVRYHGSRYDSQAPQDLLMQGQYKFLEWEDMYAGKKVLSQGKPDGRAIRSTSIKSRQSSFDFEVTLPEPVSPLFKPGFKISNVKILNAANGDVLAQSGEFVYGGGMIGAYIAYFLNGWNQGSDTYSCGYVDRNIHLFRSNDLYKEYLAKDREFIQKILVPLH